MPAQLFGQGRSRHLRHDYVGDQKIDGGAGCGDQAQGFLTVGGFQQPVPVVRQHIGEEQPDRLLVFDEQDRLPAAVGSGGGGRRSGLERAGQPIAASREDQLVGQPDEQRVLGQDIPIDDDQRQGAANTCDERRRQRLVEKGYTLGVEIGFAR